jgi:hypothetical protein
MTELRSVPHGLVVALLLSLLTLTCGASLIWLPGPVWSFAGGAKAALGVVFLVVGINLSFALVVSLAEISS